MLRQHPAALDPGHVLVRLGFSECSLIRGELGQRVSLLVPVEAFDVIASDRTPPVPVSLVFSITILRGLSLDGFGDLSPQASIGFVVPAD